MFLVLLWGDRATAQTSPERYRKTAVYLTVGEGATGRGIAAGAKPAAICRRWFDLFRRFLVDLETASPGDLLGRSVIAPSGRATTRRKLPDVFGVQDADTRSVASDGGREVAAQVGIELSCHFAAVL